MVSQVSCCHNCPNRTLGCHANCETYKAQKEAWMREKKKYKDDKFRRELGRK